MIEVHTEVEEDKDHTGEGIRLPSFLRSVIMMSGSQRAEISGEGHHLSAFWVIWGWSSFLPSEVTAAFLFAQLERIQDIQEQRIRIWERYYQHLSFLQERGTYLPEIPIYATNNAHMFYLTCADLDERNRLIEFVRSKGAHPVFHYLSLHKSPFFEGQHDGRELVNSDRFTDTLVRLPFYYEIGSDQEVVIESIKSFFS